MRYVLVVSEPWDFEGPDGKNVIYGEVKILSDELALFLADHWYEMEGIKSNIFVVMPRHRGYTFRRLNIGGLSVNVGILKTDVYHRFQETQNNIEILKKESRFVLIGSIEKNTKW